MYADYSYYAGTYGGSLIPEADWNYAAGKASDQINAVTFGRLRDSVPEEYAVQVQRCCCELAEVLYSSVILPMRAASANGTGQLVSTETNSTYSVTYRAGTAASALLSGGSGSGEDVLCAVAEKHLGNTGLMYKGADAW